MLAKPAVRGLDPSRISPMREDTRQSGPSGYSAPSSTQQRSTGPTVCSYCAGQFTVESNRDGACPKSPLPNKRHATAPTLAVRPTRAASTMNVMNVPGVASNPATAGRGPVPFTAPATSPTTQTQARPPTQVCSYCSLVFTMESNRDGICPRSALPNRRHGTTPNPIPTSATNPALTVPSSSGPRPGASPQRPRPPCVTPVAPIVTSPTLAPSPPALSPSTPQAPIKDGYQQSPTHPNSNSYPSNLTSISSTLVRNSPGSFTGIQNNSAAGLANNKNQTSPERRSHTMLPRSQQLTCQYCSASFTPANNTNGCCPSSPLPTRRHTANFELSVPTIDQARSPSPMTSVNVKSPTIPPTTPPLSAALAPPRAVPVPRNPQVVPSIPTNNLTVETPAEREPSFKLSPNTASRPSTPLVPTLSPTHEPQKTLSSSTISTTGPHSPVHGQRTWMETWVRKLKKVVSEGAGYADRYLVLLHNGELHYFRQPPNSVPIKSNKTIDLVKAAVMGTVGNKITIWPATVSRNYVLVFPSVEIQKSWLQAMQKVSSASMKSQDDFEILKCIGEGNFAKVYKVKSKSNQRIYALKVINKESLVNPSDFEDVLTEKLILQTLYHPFIVNLHAAFQTSDKLYMLMSFLEGGELYTLVQKYDFAPGTVKFYMACLTLALGHLHANGIMHRDLKLENLMLDSMGYLILTDFGLSKQKANSRFTFVGSLEYMAPEMINEHPYTSAIDWWAMGCITYELHAGRHPFIGANGRASRQAILHQEPTFDPSKFTEPTKKIVIGLLSKDPDKRLQKKDDVMKESYFSGFDWLGLENGTLTPPWKPVCEENEKFDQMAVSQEAVIRPSKAGPTLQNFDFARSFSIC